MQRRVPACDAVPDKPPRDDWGAVTASFLGEILNAAAIPIPVSWHRQQLKTLMYPFISFISSQALQPPSFAFAKMHCPQTPLSPNTGKKKNRGDTRQTVVSCDFAGI